MTPAPAARYTPVDAASDHEELVEFLCSHDWPFHGRSTLEPAHVEDMEFSTEDVASFWVDIGGQHVGLVRLQDLGDVEDGSPVFDLRVVPEYRGRGVGKAATTWLTSHLFATYAVLHRIEATTREDNLAMRRVLERVGYRLEGQLRESWHSADGSRRDTMIYGILRSDLT